MIPVMIFFRTRAVGIDFVHNVSYIEIGAQHHHHNRCVEITRQYVQYTFTTFVLIDERMAWHLFRMLVII